MSAAPSDDLRAAVAAQGWFHTIDLGDGIVTDGRDESPRKLGWIGLPRDLRGRTVLDVGAWDGFFSFECERRGAERVVALDGPAWQRARLGPGRVRDALGVRARAARARLAAWRTSSSSSTTISPEAVGRFDVVLFLGVLYHLKHPWVALERVASVCDGLLILETHADLLDVRRPAMALYPGDEVAGDASNWWGPNLAALKAMLREEGFARVEVVHREPLPYRLARAGYRRLRGPRFRAQQGRVVVHAHRALAGPRGAHEHGSALEHERRSGGRSAASPAASARGSRAPRRRAARGRARRLSNVISAPAGVTWRLREVAANGSRRARGRTVAWTDQPRALRVELEAAARAAPATRSARASWAAPSSRGRRGPMAASRPR